MKKIGKFFLNLFTKNIGLKILALVLAAIAVAFINIKPFADKSGEEETEAVAAVVSVCE